MKKIISDFNSMTINDRVEVLTDDARFIHRIEGPWYLVDVYMLYHEIVTVCFNRAELRVTSVTMHEYQDLDFITEEITLPYNYNVRNK